MTVSRMTQTRLASALASKPCLKLLLLFTPSLLYNLYPWTQQPHSAFAVAYFACAITGLALLKYTWTALVDRSRQNTKFSIILIYCICSSSNGRKTNIMIRCILLCRLGMYRRPWWLFGCPLAAALLILAFSIFSVHCSMDLLRASILRSSVSIGGVATSGSSCRLVQYIHYPPRLLSLPLQQRRILSLS
jgi:hypothetical protein